MQIAIRSSGVKITYENRFRWVSPSRLLSLLEFRQVAKCVEFSLTLQSEKEWVSDMLTLSELTSEEIIQGG